MRLRLYHYWRSSSSWRVRWALAIKGVVPELVSIDLLTDESTSPEHLARNPLGVVPVVELLDAKLPAKYLAESMAIIEWIDEAIPAPALLPSDAWGKARVRQLAEVINSGTQPFQNSGVAAFYSDDPQEQLNWNQHWIRHGLGAYEALVQSTAGGFSFGNTVTLADLFLIPQCHNALRYHVDLADFPIIQRIHALALETDSCTASAPDRYKPVS